LDSRHIRLGTRSPCPHCALTIRSSRTGSSCG
jgi:hypothetical protein